MAQTIAQQLNVKDFPFQIRDKNGNEIYWENSYGYWFKREYDLNGKCIYYDSPVGTFVNNRPNPSCEGKIVEIDGKKYKLTQV